MLQQKAEVLDKVKHRFRRAIGNEDDEPEEGAGDAGALKDEKQQVSLHPCKAWRSLQTGRHFDVSICGASTNHRCRRRMSNRQAEAVRNRAGNSRSLCTGAEPVGLLDGVDQTGPEGVQRMSQTQNRQGLWGSEGGEGEKTPQTLSSMKHLWYTAPIFSAQLSQPQEHVCCT